MARETKFRVKINEKHLSSDWIYYTLDDLIAGYPVNDGLNKLNTIKCEYTGLIDKNHKEIYEGDILIRYCSCCKHDKNSEFHHKAHIGFIDGAFKLIDQNYHYRIKEWEVIGNIYENLELLEKI